MIVLPHGLYYGRLGTEDAMPLVDSYKAGDVYALDRYRGRSCYKAPVQAAEYYLRAETHQHALDAFSLVDADQQDDVWTCRFRSKGDDLVHELFVLARRVRVHHSAQLPQTGHRARPPIPPALPLRPRPHPGLTCVTAATSGDWGRQERYCSATVSSETKQFRNQTVQEPK